MSTLIKFKLNKNPLIAKKINENETLDEVRKKLANKMPKNSFFSFADGTEIDFEDEKSIKLNEIFEKIENSNVVFINTKTEEKIDIQEIPNEKPRSNCNNYKIKEVESENIVKEKENEIISEEEDLPDWLLESSQNHLSNKSTNKDSNNEILENYSNRSSNKFKDYDAVPLPGEEYNNHLYQDNKYNSKENSISNILKFDEKQLSDTTKYQFIEKKGDLKIYLYKSAQFNDYEEAKSLSFMVVGETGCGKTTLLNSFVNALLGVQYKDNFRFQIIREKMNKSQAHSQTDKVNYYNIRSVGDYPPIKIIDTPGYGDTRGIKRDKQITEQIKYLFQKEISTLNSVCFVTKSSNNRLTHSQKYILSSIMDLFGEDVKDIFLFMLTFCDGGEPNILGPLKEKDCPFNKVISSFKDKSWYFKFNNSAIFEPKRNDEFTKMFWDLGMKNFKLFNQKLKSLPRKSLQLSRQVLEERKSLEDKVEILSRKLKDGLNKIEEIKNIIKILVEIKGDLNDSQNFTKKIKVPGVKKIPKDPNVYATTCLICTKTCHRTCLIEDDDNKKNCSAMDSKGFCFYCPKKCIWSEHKNRDYILEDIEEEKTITLEDLKKRFYNSKENLSVKKQLFNGARDELVRLNIECLETQEQMKNSINKLHEIALNKSVFESAEEHINLLIEIEKSEHKEGWQKRVNGLEYLKYQKRMLREVYQDTNVHIKTIKDFVEKEINKYYEMDIDKVNVNQTKNRKDCLIF